LNPYHGDYFSRKGQYNQGIEKLLQVWPSSSQYACVTVPAYIAAGLLKNIDHKSSEEKVHGDGKGCKLQKSSLGPQDQEFHQDMLQKLALHLAAQPDVQSESLQREAEEPQVRNAQVVYSDDVAAFPSRAKAAGKNLSPQEQELQQEMLRKLALHLAAQSAAEEAHAPNVESAATSEDTVKTKQIEDPISTPEVYPSTPSSFGEENCAHYYIGDEDYDDVVDDTCQCWPYTAHFVWVPMHIAYGLLDGIVPRPESSGKGAKGSRHEQKLRPQEQELHQQMLQKLALHLAAQPDSPPGQQQEGYDQVDVTAATVPDQTQDQVLCHTQASQATPKTRWADITDDLEICQAPFDSADPKCSGISRTMNIDKTHRKDEVRKSGMSPQPTYCGGSKELKSKASSFSSRHQKPEQQEFQQEMLKKLALHLAAQSDADDCPVEATLRSVLEAQTLGEDKARCNRLILQLDQSSSTPEAAVEASKIVDWVIPGTRTLSLMQCGSRLVQKTVDVASFEKREQLLEALLPEVVEIYTSPHANHVLAKLVEIMPPKSLAGLGNSLRGKATTVARHQFGGRILERLIEHCDEDQIGFLLDELLDDFEALARHQFGNFVVTRLLEHGTAARKHTCVQKLLPHVLQHATHKTACNIVQRMLEHADLSCQAAIADAFLAGTGETSLEVIATTRYGSFVIQHLVDRFHPRIDAVKSRIKGAHSQLQESGFSRRKIVDLLGESFFRE
jgi:hypothetical protein